VFAAIEDARLFFDKIDQHQLVAVIRQRNLILLWRNRKRNHATDIKAREFLWFGDFVGTMDLQRFLSLGVGDDDQPLAVIQPLREPESSGRRLAVLLNRAVEVAERDELAANRQRQQMALRMRLIILQEFGGLNEFAISLRARAVELDRDLFRFVLCWIEKIKIAALFRTSDPKSQPTDNFVANSPFAACGLSEISKNADSETLTLKLSRQLTDKQKAYM